MTKLLLVEDDNNLREIYEARLQAEGYTIVSAHDGEEALVVAKAEKPDLIISDIMMPKISGFEMLDILRNTEGLQDVKVIMLTALGQSDDQQRADRLGADRYLVKSQVTLEDIVKVAHELMADGGATPAADPAPVGTTNTDVPASPAPAPAPAPTDGTAPASIPVNDSPSAPATTPEPVTKEAAPETATPEIAQAEASSDAEPMAKEESEVEAKIEDFVAGASETPSPTLTPTDPVAPPEPDDAPILPAPEAPADASPSTTAPELATPPAGETAPSNDATPADEASATAADDKLVSDAADQLEAGTEPAKEQTIDESDLPSHKQVGGERVIQPIASEPTKDISTLVAEEEAKENGTASSPVLPAAIIVDDKQGQVPPAPAAPAISPARANDGSAPRPDGEPVDPSSIAL